MPDETRTGNGVTFQKLVEDLKVIVQDSEELLKTGAGQLRQKAFAGAKYTDEGIRRNLYPSMGIVFGLGLILGLLSYNLISGGPRQIEVHNG